MKDWNVSLKLLGLVGLSVIAFAGLGAYGLFNTTSAFTWVGAVYHTAVDFREARQKISAPLSELRQLSLLIVMTPDPQLQQAYRDRQQSLTQNLDQALREWSVAREDPQEAATFAPFLASWKNYQQVNQATVEKALQDQWEDAFLNATGPEREQFDAVVADLAQWMDTKIEQAERTHRDANAQYRQVLWVSTLVILLMTLIVGAFGLRIAQSIVRPIQVLKQAAARIADRQPITEIAVTSRDELGSLARDMERMARAIQTDTSRQQAAEAEVRSLNASLEQRVRERTTELEELTDTLRQAKREAEKNAAWARRVVETAFDAFVVMDATGHIRDWNPRAEAVFGWSRQEAIGRLLAETIIPVEYRDPHTRGLAHFLATDEGPALNQRLEMPALHRDGHCFPVELTIVPLRLGQEYVFTAFLHDISDRKRAEEELREAKEAAEAANRAKSEFLANMSHEIRTPMNGVLGMTELALDTQLTPEQREFLEAAKMSADYLLVVINDILEAGKLDLDPIYFDLRDHLDESVSTVALKAHIKGLELVVDVQDDVPDTLVGDPGRLRQILVNLIGNAVKFTPVGEVVLSVEKEAETATEVRLHFAIRDTGIGIPASKVDLLFKAFSQVDSSTTRKFGGTGLGLAISSQLVRLMDGRIWVESAEGKGSTFHFTATFGLGRGPIPPRPAPDLTRVKDLPVLVVDDNGTNRRILRELLRNWGMRPTAVASGTEALAALKQAAGESRPFAMVLLDHMMPEMDGLMLAEEIQRHPELASSVLMMLSSSDRREKAARCRELGLTAYLSKPIRRSELLDGIMAMVSPPTATQPAEARRREFGRCDRSLRLVLAEDNLINQKLAIRLLEKRGHKIEVVNNGKELLDVLERGRYDLILMDVMMPEMDGLEATLAIRAREAETGGHIPIVAMTAHAMKGDRERCLEVGMDGYLAKPLQPGELFETIESLVGAP